VSEVTSWEVEADDDGDGVPDAAVGLCRLNQVDP
jgi:hypothetical protein